MNDQIPNLSQSNPEIHQNRDSGILSESAYSSFEEAPSIEEDKDTPQLVRTVTLEDIPEEDVRDDNSSSKHRDSDQPGTSSSTRRRKNVDSYVDDVIVEMRDDGEPVIENAKL